MSEKIDMEKLGDGRGELAQNMCWAIIETMVAKDVDMTPWKNDIEKEKLIFDVEMKINGVEVQFSTVIKMLFEQYGKQVEDKALELMEDRFADMSDHMNEFMDSLKYKIEKNWSEK